MFGLEMLDVLIGLVTVYLAFGMACTAIVEAISAWLNVRSKNLEAALNEVFAGIYKPDETFVKAFYKHPLIQALSKGTDCRPSYIPPEIVGQVVESLVTANVAVKSFTEAVNSLPGTPETNRIKGVLTTFVTQTKEDTTAFRKAVETHFDAAMDRSSGWFKRYTQNVAIIVSVVLVIGANVDTVNLTVSLASSPTVRLKMVEIAEQRLKEAKNTEDEAKAAKQESEYEKAKNQSEAAQKVLDRAVSDMETAGLQFGWKDYPKTFSEILLKVVGLLVSILAVSLGAPFWFDVLQKFMQVRAAGASPGEPKKKKN
ncbi:MAG: hypothetical protein NTW12_13295 [Deltaproteobacteria bacterium]|nr:hypothetical protein [Deltaproteobacteria bacterium]